MIINNLAKLLDERHVSQIELSKMVGVSRSTINHFASGSSSSFNTNVVNRICQCLDIEMSELFSYSPFDVVFSTTVDELTTTSDFTKNIYIDKLKVKLEITVSSREIVVTKTCVSGQLLNNPFDINQPYPIMRVHFDLERADSVTISKIDTLELPLKAYLLQQINQSIAKEIQTALSKQDLSTELVKNLTVKANLQPIL